MRAQIVEKLPTFGGGLLGLEGLMILRAEKGFIVVGKDTDGTTMPHDLGITGPREQRKDEYIGKSSLFTPVAKDKARKQLVGLNVVRRETPLPTGAHVVDGDEQGAPVARLCHLELSEPDARPSGRARPGGGGFLASRRGGRRLSSRRGMARLDRPAVALDPEGKRLHA